MWNARHAAPVYSAPVMRRYLPLLVLALIVLFPALAFAGADGDFEEYRSQGWVWMYLGSFGAEIGRAHV